MNFEAAMQMAFALSLIGGPNVVRIYNRAKWKLGFKDRRNAEKQGDHMTGRVFGLRELNEKLSAAVSTT